MAHRLLSALLVAALLAGCSEPEDAAPAAPAPPPPVPVDEAVDWSATMAPSDCIQGPATVCSSGTFNGDETEPTYEHDAAGRDLAGGNLTLEWTAATPTTEALQVRVLALDDCPGECTLNRSIATVNGESPLRVQVPAWDLAEGMSIGVRVSPLPFAPGVQATAGQDVHLSGTLSFVEDADGDPEPDEDEEDEEGDS